MKVVFCLLHALKAECKARKDTETEIPICWNGPGECLYRRSVDVEIPDKIKKEYNELSKKMPF
jgi:hypothetical protein